MRQPVRWPGPDLSLCPAPALPPRVARLDQSLPPAYDTPASSSVKITKKSLSKVGAAKVGLFQALDGKPANPFLGEASVTQVKLYESKSKKPAIRKRVSASALFRELNKDKLTKQVRRRKEGDE